MQPVSTGVGIVVYGTSLGASGHGSRPRYEIALDGASTTQEASTPFTETSGSTVLFRRDGLDPNVQHNIALKNLAFPDGTLPDLTLWYATALLRASSSK
jgi:hypothetical protein